MWANSKQNVHKKIKIKKCPIDRCIDQLLSWLFISDERDIKNKRFVARIQSEPPKSRMKNHADI
jgi:hypothetical protein